MNDDIVNYVDNCYSCKINKAQHQSDVIVKLSICKDTRNQHVLTFIDRFTKFVELIPITEIKAETTARHFIDRVILRHGTPRN